MKITKEDAQALLGAHERAHDLATHLLREAIRWAAKEQAPLSTVLWGAEINASFWRRVVRDTHDPAPDATVKEMVHALRAQASECALGMYEGGIGDEVRNHVFRKDKNPEKFKFGAVAFGHGKKGPEA